MSAECPTCGGPVVIISAAKAKAFRVEDAKRHRFACKVLGCGKSFTTRKGRGSHQRVHREANA